MNNKIIDFLFIQTNIDILCAFFGLSKYIYLLPNYQIERSGENINKCMYVEREMMNIFKK